MGQGQALRRHFEIGVPRFPPAAALGSNSITGIWAQSGV